MDKFFGRAKDKLSRTLSSASSKKKVAAGEKEVSGGEKKIATDEKRSLAVSNPYNNGQASTPQSATGSDDAPPAYTVTGPPVTGPLVTSTPPNYGSATPPASEYTMENLQNHSDDPLYFLYLLDTVFLIDDSSSMLGSRWAEVKAALRQLAPVCTSYDDDGIDVHFMNHKCRGGSAEGKAPGGCYDITDASAVEKLFTSVRPCGPTPTRGRLEDILNPYFVQLRAAADVRDVKPLSLVVLTDGMPGPALLNGNNPHMPEPAIVHFARELDRLKAPLYQLGIQFIQVGNNVGATAMLEALDDGLPRRYNCRDIADTLKFGQGGYTTLTADQILKAVLGGVNKRLDNQRCL